MTSGQQVAPGVGRARRTVGAVGVLALLGAWCAPADSPAGAATGAAMPPGAPAHAVALVVGDAVEVAWSATPASAAAPVASYDVAPLSGGLPCPSCRGALAVPAGQASVTLGSVGATVATYAVRAANAAGASPWVVAARPGAAGSPAGEQPELARPAAAAAAPATAERAAAATSVGSPGATAQAAPGVSGRAAGGTPGGGTAAATLGTAGGPWVAQPVAGQYASPLDAAPAGWTRTVERDDGFSAPTAADGDLWVFGDTTVVDTPDGSGAATGSVTCFTRDGTAAVAPPALPPDLAEALQPLPAAVASGSAQCTGDVAAEPATATEPYQLLGDYPDLLPGTTCANWVNGLADQRQPTGGLSDGVLASYGSECLGQADQIVGVAGTWTTGYQATSSGEQVVTVPLGQASLPDLPPATCPAAAATSYDGGAPGTGDYGSALEVGGYLYLYQPYGNSTDAFAALGVPESTCSAMAVARVPVGDGPGGLPDASDPADYQYLLPGGQWASPATTGLAPSVLAGESADVLPPGYDGAYAGQVDVTQLASGELAMVYLLPDPVAAPGGGTDVAAVRTATSPAGPWSAPVLFEIPGFDWGSDYQVLLHPELSTAATLALSYVAVSSAGGSSAGGSSTASSVVGRQVVFATLPTATLPPPGTAPATGYREVAADGGLFAFGTASFDGSMGGRHLNAPIVGMAAVPGGGAATPSATGAATPSASGTATSSASGTATSSASGTATSSASGTATSSASGYWEVASDGGIFAFGSARFYGSMGGQHLNAPIVGMAVPPTGHGYWEVASDGGIFAFGSARFYGSMGGRHLNAPVVGIAAGPTGRGYWEVASDGGIFAFGDAPFYGSMGGQHLNAPVVGMAATPSGTGYWEVASDGGVFAFGSARFYGSMGGQPLNDPVVGAAAAPTGTGYWEVASDGGIFAFGSARFYGSMGGRPLNEPVAGLAVTTTA